MISSDQPTIFGDSLTAGVSSADDGNMKTTGFEPEEVYANRQAFLSSLGIDLTQATLLAMSYDTTDFTRYVVFDDEQKGEGMLSPGTLTDVDAAVVTRPGHAIFLLLADCAGMIVYDPENEILMVSHLGRHNVEQNGAARSIKFLVEEFGSDPRTLQIYLSPMVGRETYPIHSLGGKGLGEVIIEQLLAAGTDPARIEMSPTDTAESEGYFSHSEFLAGNRTLDGRFAVVAMMRE